jgi:hypothetical protein
MLDDALLEAFARGFFGYGDHRARYWFVGMEEGGGGSEEEIKRRLEAWDSRGRRELEDLAGFHEAFGGDEKWFRKRNVQPTWGRLIRIFLAAEGIEADLETVRNYQCDRLARSGSAMALLEVMPLPSPTIAHWLYKSMTISTLFRSRAGYEALRQVRLQRIQELINTHRPPFVITYGGSRPSLTAPPGTRIEHIKHPLAHGVTNDSLAGIGRRLRTAE